jgi:hypothetical protein
MKSDSRRRLVIPATLAVTVLGAACAPSPSGPACDPVRVMDAGAVTFMCKDGRTCDAPDLTAIDGGVYQICPGNGDCALLVSYDGQSMLGFC